MNYRWYILCCLSLQLFLAVDTQAESSPNIVFFFVDDQTTDTLGCYGNSVIKTPNIDALAERGTRFENAFVSQSICWMSRVTILTGLTGRSFGEKGRPEFARPEVVENLYSDVLRKHGYRTGYFGKWHAKMPKGFRPEEHFDEYEAISRNPYYKVQPDGTLRHETEVIVDRGIEFLKGQTKDKPFALNLWFNACHAEDGDRRPGIGHFPWPRAMDGMYDDVMIAPPRLNDPAIFDGLPDFLRTTINRERYFWRWNTDGKYQANMRAYYRMTSGIDSAIGRFMKALEDAGLAENTIVVYSADNGYYKANRGLAGKWSHYDESLRVPLIVADPRQPVAEKGTVSKAFVLNLDLPATFLDWADAAVPRGYQGRSLAPIIEGDVPVDWRKETFHEHFAVRDRIPAFEGLRSERFKYVRYFDDDNHEFLHDLQHDPDELVNLAGDPNYAASLKTMRARTSAKVESLGGPLQDPQREFTRSSDPYPEASANVSAKLDEDGFAQIFDGRTLKGWSGLEANWSVEDRALTGVSDGSLKSHRSITWTHSTVRNFDLRVKVKVSAEGNGGIQYRGTSRPEIGIDVVTGYRCNVAGRAQRNGMLYEAEGQRFLSRAGEKVVVDPSGQPWIVENFPVKELAPGQWHDYRIVVEGNHHRHWIDGHPTVDLIEFDREGRSREGVLGLQIPVGPAMKVQYKDFRLKHLPDDLPLLSEEDHPIPANAYGVKSHGKLP